MSPIYDRKQSDRQKLGHLYLDHKLVNCTDDSKPIGPINLLGQFYRLLEEADIPKIFHDLRHLNATLLMGIVFQNSVKYGGIPNFEIGSSKRVDKSDFKAWIEKRKVDYLRIE